MYNLVTDEHETADTLLFYLQVCHLSLDIWAELQVGLIVIPGLF